VAAKEKDRILRLPEVAEITTLEEQTLYAMRSQGRGPRSFKLGNRVAYKESSVREWIAQQEQAEEERLNRIHQVAG
jgi:predicted DNA-binding transcriptional regulator AlpA